jgi:16S rRNA (guanine527-N7)-methyltransferase
VAQDWKHCRATLDAGIEAMRLDIAEEQRQKLLAYLEELEKWNRTYNLTAVRDPQEMVTRHLLDSLSVLPHLHGTRIIDVGTGAGLPGIPLALAAGDRSFSLLESNGKKVSFLRHVLRSLPVGNAEVVHARAEDYLAGKGGFDSVISRAFASIEDMLRMSGHLCAGSGRILAMKGKLAEEELAAARGPRFRLDSVVALQVPGLAEQRHLAIFSPAG